jgi:hypothetical protein
MELIKQKKSVYTPDSSFEKWSAADTKSWKARAGLGKASDFGFLTELVGQLVVAQQSGHHVHEAPRDRSIIDPFTGLPRTGLRGPDIPHEYKRPSPFK